MCQFCKRDIRRVEPAIEYCARLFHVNCFDKLCQVAIRTGGIL